MKPRTTLPCLAALLTFVFGLNLHGASTLKFEYSQYSATEDTPSVLVAVLRAGDLTGPASVEVVSYDISATAGQDYEATNLTVEFADGEEVQTFRVPLLNDGTEESDERFRLMLENPSEGSELGAPNFAIIILKDNDPGVQFPWKHFWGYERDGQITVTVERGNDGNLSPFTVDYATSDLTAVAGLDYTAVTGTLEFAEGEMTQTIIIPVADDAEFESREEFQLTLSNPTAPGGLGPNTTATVWLYDTTGHEPRHFGTAWIRHPTGPRDRLSCELPLRGRANGSSMPLYELYGVESSADLRFWQPSAWIAWSPASGDPPPTHRYTYHIRSDYSWHIPKQFFRMIASPLMAGWPPPFGDTFAFGHPAYGPGAGYAVGYTERWVTDPTRRNRYGISDNSSFQVAIWYPAKPRTGMMPQRFLDEREVHFWMDTWDYPAACPPPDTMWSYSFRDIPPREFVSRLPIILYSHAGEGWSGHSEQVWHYAEHLASQGYIVMAPNHYDCWHTELPDGSRYATATTPARDAAGFKDRMRDFEVLLDLFPEWQESDPILAGRLDLSNIGAMGFQFGAGIAAELCRTVDACKAGVLLISWDGSFIGADELWEHGPGKPLMFIQSSVEDSKNLYSRMEQDAVWFQLADSYWQSLQAWYPWDNLLLGRPIEQNVIDHEITQSVNAYIGSFFDAKVRDNTRNVLWQGPSPENPRVINYERK